MDNNSKMGGMVEGTLVGCREPALDSATGEQTPWRILVATAFPAYKETWFDWCPEFGRFDPDNLDQFTVMVFSTGSIVDEGTGLKIFKDTRDNLKKVAVSMAAAKKRIEENKPPDSGNTISLADAMARRSEGPARSPVDIDKMAGDANWVVSRIHPWKTNSLTTADGNGVFVDERDEAKGISLRFGKSSVKLSDGLDLNAASFNTSFEETQVNWGGWQPCLLQKYFPPTIVFPYPPRMPMPPLGFLATMGSIGAAFGGI